MHQIRLQQNGDAYRPAGLPKLPWRKVAIEVTGIRGGASVGTLMGRPLEGAGAVSKEASAATPLEELTRPGGAASAAPLSAMTIASFVENIFVPEHVATKKLSGRTHYHAILKHVLTPEEVDRVFQVDTAKARTRLKSVPNWPYLGGIRLCDARAEDVQPLISAALERGYSTQTVKHIRNVVSAIFEHARRKQYFAGENPASQVTLPEMSRKDAHVLTLAQAAEVLAVMQYPEKEMTLIAILTSMNLAEICGLQWKRVNLTEEWRTVEGEAIPPRTIAVRTQWYRCELANVVKKSRHRNLPIPAPLFPTLVGLSHRANFAGPDDFVLVSRAGTPINESSIATRRLKRIGKDLQMPWLSWHAFRRTHTTLAHELGMQFLGDRVAGER